MGFGPQLEHRKAGASISWRRSLLPAKELVMVCMMSERIRRISVTVSSPGSEAGPMLLVFRLKPGRRRVYLRPRSAVSRIGWLPMVLLLLSEGRDCSAGSSAVGRSVVVRHCRNRCEEETGQRSSRRNDK